jgi:hypothetical protein
MFGVSSLTNLITLSNVEISLTNQNAASLSNVHTCNNVRVPGGIARGENGIRYPNVTDPSKYTISNDFAFYIISLVKFRSLLNFYKKSS